MMYKRIAAIVVVLVLVVVTIVFRSWSNSLEIALGMPSVTSVFLSYSRAAMTTVDQESDVSSIMERDAPVLRVFNLREREAMSKISFEGITPVIVFRCRTDGFTDDPSSGYLLYAYVADTNKDRDMYLITRNKKYTIEHMPGGDDSDLFVPELVDRETSHSSAIATYPYRPDPLARKLWKRESDDVRGLPVVSVRPIFQADWFENGIWLGTVAWFESSESASRASLSHP